MKKYLLCFLFIIFSGCVTIKDYSSNQNTLVVGQIKYIRNTQSNRVANHIYQSGITIIIRKLNDNKDIKVITQNDGLFILEDLKEGVYDFVETKFEKEIGNTIYHLGARINRYFYISENRVNNLGIIIQDIQEREYTLQTIEYDTVRNNFNEKYPKLQWNNIEWLETFLTYNIPSYINYDKEMDNENWNIELLDTARKISYLTSVEKDIILELNKVRSDPKKYAELYIKPMLQYFDGYLYIEPGKEKATHEGLISAEECYQELIKMEKRTLLFSEHGLSLGAKDHVKDQGTVGITGHIGTDRSNPYNRAMRYGTGNFIGENISYGPNKANEMIIGLLIDDGVPDRGHRKSIMFQEFDQVGVAIGIHKRYGTMCVIMLAKEYESR